MPLPVTATAAVPTPPQIAVTAPAAVASIATSAAAAPAAPAPASLAPAASAPVSLAPASASAKTASLNDAGKLKIEILRLEGLVKKLQSELQAEREYARALEAHVKTLQEAD